uniref:Homer 2 n=1 Tax=Anthurium amnicola TaxID=1678845 RepID=A0A1D1XRF5_9ARAE
MERKFKWWRRLPNLLLRPSSYVLLDQETQPLLNMDDYTEENYVEINGWKNAQELVQSTEASHERSLVPKRNTDEQMNRVSDFNSVHVRGRYTEEQAKAMETIHQKSLLMEKKVDELMKQVELLKPTPMKEAKMEEQGRELERIREINTHMEKRIDELTKKVYSLEVMSLDDSCEKLHQLALAEVKQKDALLERNLNELKQKVKSLESPFLNISGGLVRHKNSVPYIKDLTSFYIITFLLFVIIGMRL